MAFGVGYLAFLTLPFWYEATSRRPTLVIAAALVAGGAFVILDLWYAWRHMLRPGRPGPALAVLAGMFAVALGLTVHDLQWAWLFVYCTVAAGGGPWSRRAAAGTVVASVAAAAAVIGVLARFQPGSGFVPLDTAFLGLIMLTSGMGMVGLARLFEYNEELRRAREEVAGLAVAEERLRFARDLHDLLGHSLSLIVLKSELAGRVAEASPERAAREIRDVERVAREALREVREAVAGYRQPSLGHELESARVALEAAGIQVRIDAAAGSLPALLDSTLAWAVREGVTNVVRHSRAGRLDIALTRRDGRVDLELLDDGVGCPGCPAGSGLRGLRERVAARGGSVDWGSVRPHGFRLTASLPLTGAPAAAAAPAVGGATAVAE